MPLRRAPRWKTLTGCFLMISFAASCAPVGDSYCTAARPLRLSAAAINAMTRDDLLQVNFQNDAYAKLCSP